MATETERVLGTHKQLSEYLKTLPSNLELRFPSVTSLKGDFAVIMIIYNTVTKCVLLGAYNTKLSGLPKDEVEVEANEFGIRTEETPFNILRFGIVKETGLVAAGKIKWLGFPLKVNNTNPDIDLDFHERNYALIDSFKGNVRMPDPILNPKIKEFVWVKDYLLEIVFDQARQLLGVPLKSHPQKEAYKRFIGNNKGRKTVTLKELLSAGKFFKRKSR